MATATTMSNSKYMLVWRKHTQALNSTTGSKYEQCKQVYNSNWWKQYNLAGCTQHWLSDYFILTCMLVSYSAKPCSAVCAACLHKCMQHRTVQYSAVQYNAVWYRPVCKCSKSTPVCICSLQKSCSSHYFKHSFLVWPARCYSLFTLQ
jgi:hypothetical protein